MNKSEAIKATRNGAIAACISAAMTAIFVLVAISTDAEEGRLAIFNDPANFIDMVLILACAYGMYRKSRIASVLMFVYFLAAKVIISIETQAYSGLILGLVFLYFFARAVQGSFVYHKLEKEENPDYQATTKWTYIVGVPSALIVTAVIMFTLLSTTGVVPSTRVLEGNEMKTDNIAILRSQGIILSNENVDYFYSHGTTSILESGNILTQEYVIFYFTNEKEELEIYEIPINEITDVVLESQGNFFTDSVYKVNTDDPDRWLKLFLSTEQKGDQKFVKALRSRLTK